MDTAPPPVVELLPLPEGCPDRINVACNSRRGVFVVRSQKVEDGTRGGTELTPSRFEALAGKAEAKKWRSSLWAVGADGTQECQMGEWLANHKLDKQLLARLLTNWTAWLLRQQWETELAEATAAAAAEPGQGEEGAGADGEAAVTEGGTEAAAGDGEEGEEEEVQQGPAKRQKRERSSTGGASEGAVSDADAAAAGEEEGDGAEGGGSTSKKDQAVAAAAAGEGDDGGQPASKKQRVAEANGTAAAAAADGGQQQQPPGDTTAAAGEPGDGGCARSTPANKTSLKRVHLLHLPLGFRVHPASLPARAAVAAAARQKQLLQQQQQAAAAAAAGAAAAAAAAGTPADASAGSAAAGGAPTAPAAPKTTDPLIAAALAPKTVDTAVNAVRNPWLCVGQCCRVYWPDDNEWYDADVTGYDPATRKHNLWYHADEIKEVRGVTSVCCTCVLCVLSCMRLLCCNRDGLVGLGCCGVHSGMVSGLHRPLLCRLVTQSSSTTTHLWNSASTGISILWASVHMSSRLEHVQNHAFQTHHVLFTC